MNTQPKPVPQTRLVLIQPGVGVALYEGRKVVAYDRSNHEYNSEDIEAVLNFPPEEMTSQS